MFAGPVKFEVAQKKPNRSIKIKHFALPHNVQITSFHHRSNRNTRARGTTSNTNIEPNNIIVPAESTFPPSSCCSYKFKIEHIIQKFFFVFF
jgi:hypothetical protein